MTKLSIGISVLLLMPGSAFAEGVNDRMPNGQQGYYQPSQPSGGRVSTAPCDLRAEKPRKRFV